ncbi:MAG: T9SS type A sorting domain-containing protein [Bacteroidetes bacterium]|nr:T9SS type A sorting domain-containing protein [Bacteroidota bacterium]
MKSVLVSFLFLTLSLAILAQKSPQQIQAQKQRIQEDTKVKSVEMSPERGTPLAIRFDIAQSGKTYQVRDARRLMRDFLQMKPIDKLEPVNNVRQKSGVQVARFQQFYKGIKVVHGQYTALSKDDELSALSGEYYDLENLNTAATLNEAQALEAAKQFVGAKEYVWEYVQSLWRGVLSPEMVKQIDQAYGEYLPKGELVIVDDFGTTETDLDLAWKFNIYANEPVSRHWIYVNAHDGHIMLADAIIKHATASVQTRYAGVQDIGTTLVLGSNPSPEYLGDEDYYILWDQTRGGGIQTYDMNGIGGAPISVPFIYTAATDLVDDDNDWTTAEHVRNPAPTVEEAVNDDIAWDAHWGASMVYDYWLDRHGRLSYDDNNAKINSYIHYGEGYDNAFWNGSVMTYGDGSYKDFGVFQINGFAPLTSLDVCGHEIGHAVCSSTCDLVYERESGAMNEAFSDIWAACMENYVTERFSNQSFDFQPWGIGEQIDFGTGPNDPNNALRWMDDPKREGDPDTYGGDGWSDPNCGTPNLANDQCGVHTNSGVLNKWFYLLTTGSGISPDDGVNDNGDAYTVVGVGFAKSEQIAFGTEVLLTPTATYAEARAAAISYARAAYGPCSAEEEAVTNAWFAVGVGAAFSCESGGATIPTGFLSTNENVSEAAQGPGFCDDSKDITVRLFVNSPVNFNLVTGGTATLGTDYTLSSSNVTHTGNNFLVKTVTIHLIDDAAAEGTETIVLSIPAGVGAVPGSDVYTLSITDDDVNPVIGIGDKSLLYERFLTTSMPAGWGVKENISSLNEWNFGGYLGRAFISLMGILPNYEANNSPTDLILHTGLIDARGLSNVTVSFDWTAGGETDIAIGGAAPFDYGELVYSFDGVNYFETGDIFVGDNFGTTIKSDSYSANLGHLFDNRQFYLGWRWQNDALFGNAAYSFSFDEVRVNASTRRVETDLADAGEEAFGPNATVYFYSADDGQLLAKVKNNTSHDFGCTTFSVERAGTGAKTWYNGGKSTDKAIRITPSNPSSSANVEITMYYTQEELNGYELASGTLRSNLKLFNTTASSIGGANSGNTAEFATAHTPIYKTPATVIGGSFTATVTGSLGGIVLAKKTNPLGILAPGGNNHGVAESQALEIYPNPASGYTTLSLPNFDEAQNLEISVFHLDGQRVWSKNLVTAGSEKIDLDLADWTPGVYLVKAKTAGQQFVKKLVVQ